MECVLQRVNLTQCRLVLTASVVFCLGWQAILTSAQLLVVHDMLEDAKVSDATNALWLAAFSYFALGASAPALSGCFALLAVR